MPAFAEAGGEGLPPNPEVEELYDHRADVRARRLEKYPTPTITISQIFLQKDAQEKITKI